MTIGVVSEVIYERFYKTRGLTVKVMRNDATTDYEVYEETDVETFPLYVGDPEDFPINGRGVPRHRLAISAALNDLKSDHWK